MTISILTRNQSNSQCHNKRRMASNIMYFLLLPLLSLYCGLAGAQKCQFPVEEQNNVFVVGSFNPDGLTQSVIIISLDIKCLNEFVIYFLKNCQECYSTCFQMTGAYQELALASTGICLCIANPKKYERLDNTLCDRSCSGNTRASSDSDICGSNI